MTRPHRGLVIGLGQIGMGYDLDLDPATHVYTHARAFSTHEAFELVGGVDPDDARRQVFESQFKRPAFDDAVKAILATKPDVVAIAGPTAMHRDLVGIVLEHAAARAVICEKPLTHNP